MSVNSSKRCTFSPASRLVSRTRKSLRSQIVLLLFKLLHIRIYNKQHPTLHRHLSMFLDQHIAHPTWLPKRKCLSLQRVIQPLCTYTAGITRQWQQRNQVPHLAIDCRTTWPAYKPAHRRPINKRYRNTFKACQQQNIRHSMIETRAPKRANQRNPRRPLINRYLHRQFSIRLILLDSSASYLATSLAQILQKQSIKRVKIPNYNSRGRTIL